MAQDNSGNKPKEPKPASRAPAPIKPLVGSYRPAAKKPKAPDWDFWLSLPTVALWQAAFLSCNVDPDTESRSDIHNRGISNEKVAKRLCVLVANFGNMNSQKSLLDVYAFGLSIRWGMPPKLVALGSVEKKTTATEPAARSDTDLSSGGMTWVDYEYVDDKDASAKSRGRPQQQQQWQESEILRVIVELGHTPTAIPKRKAGQSGVKSEVRKALRFSKTVFDKAWERLRADMRVADSEK